MLKRKIVYLINFDKDAMDVLASPGGFPQSLHLVESYEDESELRHQIIADLSVLIPGNATYSLRPINKEKVTSGDGWLQTLFIRADIERAESLPTFYMRYPVDTVILAPEECNWDVDLECTFTAEEKM